MPEQAEAPPGDCPQQIDEVERARYQHEAED